MAGKLIRNSKNGFAVSDVHIRGDPPDKIVKVSDNEVYAVYGSFKQTWKAEGSGDERYNFTETIEEGDWL